MPNFASSFYSALKGPHAKQKQKQTTGPIQSSSSECEKHLNDAGVTEKRETTICLVLAAMK
jgi:hypothetical protein